MDLDNVVWVGRIITVALAALVFAAVLAYVIARAASFAVLRSKYEHYRMMRRVNQEDENGKV